MRSSLSCSVLRVKKLLITVPLVLLLGGCTVMDVVGPRPNKEVMALAKQAHADGLPSGATEDYRQLRTEQSDALKAEALRLCGITPEGEAPSSCSVNFDDAELPASIGAQELVSLTADTAPRLPKESVALAVEQAIDATAMQPVALDNVGSATLTSEADITHTTAVVQREAELQYGLGFALAFADDPLRERIAVLREASRERSEALSPSIPLDDGSLAPSPGYQFVEGHTEPTTLEEAQLLVDALQRAVIDETAAAAANAEEATFMHDAILLAAHARRV